MNKLYKQIATLGFGCFLSAVGHSTVLNSSDANSALGPQRPSCARWSSREDAILQAKVSELGGDWYEISKFLPGRTPETCRGEFHSIERHKRRQENHETQQKTKRKNTARFTPEEDTALSQAVTQYGIRDCALIASFVPGRTARQCRDRWNSHLNPILNLLPWTPDKDDLLLQKYQELGHKWTRIAAFFPDRTDMQCKNRWHTLQRHHRKAQLAPPAQQPAAVLPAQSTQQSAQPPAAPQNGSESYSDDDFTDPFNQFSWW
jgi:hypothetical protein